MLKDGRGENKKALAKSNLEKIRAWIKKNPNATLTECCEGVGMTYKTVKGHINTIQRRFKNE